LQEWLVLVKKGFGVEVVEGREQEAALLMLRVLEVEEHLME